MPFCSDFVILVAQAAVCSVVMALLGRVYCAYLRGKMKRALALVFLAIAACEPVQTDEAGVPLLNDISPEALAALPAGVPPSLLIRDANGCYGIAIEKTEPQIGAALLDANRQPICDA